MVVALNEMICEYERIISHRKKIYDIRESPDQRDTLTPLPLLASFRVNIYPLQKKLTTKIPLKCKTVSCILLSHWYQFTIIHYWNRIYFRFNKLRMQLHLVFLFCLGLHFIIAMDKRILHGKQVTNFGRVIFGKHL